MTGTIHPRCQHRNVRGVCDTPRSQRFDASQWARGFTAWPFPAHALTGETTKLRRLMGELRSESTDVGCGGGHDDGVVVRRGG